MDLIMEKNSDDPYGFLTRHSIIPNDQGDDLRLSPTFCDPTADHDSDSSSGYERFRLQSSGIFMVSPPESLQHKDDGSPHDVFQTPPEQSSLPDSEEPRSAAVNGNGFEDEFGDVEGEKGNVEDAKAVDLGRDSDLGLYSEVQLTHTGGIFHAGELIRNVGVGGSEVSAPVAKVLEISSDDLRCEVRLGEPPSKRMKLSEENLCSGSCTRTIVEKLSVDWTKSVGESKVAPFSSSDHNNGMAEVVLVETDSGDEGFREKYSTKRVLKFPHELEANGKNGTETIHSEELEEMELNKSVVEKAENCEVIDLNDGKVHNEDDGQFQRNDNEKCAEEELRGNVKDAQFDKQSNLQETINHHQLCRKLPPSITGVMNDAAENSDSDANDARKHTLLDILKILKGEEESDEDESSSDECIFEIVQRRGMTFPRPRWWPEGGFR